MTDGKDDPIPRLSDMLNMTGDERAQYQLRILEGLFARAVKADKYSEALKVMEAAQKLFARFGKR